jgi:hypothetical protein
MPIGGLSTPGLLRAYVVVDPIETNPPMSGPVKWSDRRLLATNPVRRTPRTE